MSKSNAHELAYLLLLFNNTAFANVGNAGGLLPSTVAGNFYLSLHTADPGEAGDQTTSETAYSGYARLAIVRSAGGFTVSAATVALAVAQVFAEAAAADGTPLTHWGLGTASSGAGVLLHSGSLGTAVTILEGTRVEIDIGTIVTED